MLNFPAWPAGNSRSHPEVLAERHWEVQSRGIKPCRRKHIERTQGLSPMDPFLLSVFATVAAAALLESLFYWFLKPERTWNRLHCVIRLSLTPLKNWKTYDKDILCF